MKASNLVPVPGAKNNQPDPVVRGPSAKMDALMKHMNRSEKYSLNAAAKAFGENAKTKDKR